MIKAMSVSGREVGLSDKCPDRRSLPRRSPLFLKRRFTAAIGKNRRKPNPVPVGLISQLVGYLIVT